MGIWEDRAALLRWERRIQRASLQALTEWGDEVRAAVLPESLTAALPPDPDGVDDARDGWMSNVDRWILPAVEALVLAHLYRSLSGVKRPPRAPGAPPTTMLTTGESSRAASAVYAFPTVRDWQQAYLGQVRNRLVATPDGVWRLVQQELNEGMALGEGALVLRDRVQRVLSSTGAVDWPGRALTIARTEATGAMNAATLRAALVEQEFLGIPMDKVWISTIDGRTRPDHFAADGQRRPLDGHFDVGGAVLDVPGDPSAPAGQVVNCRCTMAKVERGEPLPGEYDRHTERGPGNATVRNRYGSQADEIERRAADGIVRAREDPDGDGYVTAAATPAQEEAVSRKWTGVLMPLGENTDDGRRMAADADVEVRALPLPLMWQRQTSGGHTDAFTVGAIHTAEVVDGQLVATGVLFDTAEAREAAEQITAGVTAPSVDYVDRQWRMVGDDGAELSEETLIAIMSGEDTETVAVMESTAVTILGATLVAVPAFGTTSLTLEGGDSDEDEGEVVGAEVTDEGGDQIAASADLEDRMALLAAAYTPRVFSADLFTDPHLTGPTPLSVDAETGRVTGHIAVWGTCHMGVRDACVTPPRSATGYALFHTSEVETTEGPLGVGRLTVGGGHADESAGVQAATAHYDNAASTWALVRAGEDEFGIWVAGVIDPTASATAVAQGASCPVSGDWRRHGGNLELVAALGVVSPGFPVPRGARDVQGRDTALVAAGALAPLARAGQPGALSEDQMERLASMVAHRVARMGSLAARADRRAAALAAEQQRRADVLARADERLARARQRRAAALAADVLGGDL